MPLFDARTGRVLLTILVILAALAFIYAARHMLITFLFAIFFAYLVDPLVSYAQRWVKGSRGKAIALVYVAFGIAEIGGVVGVYLSIPIMASVRIFWRHWRAYLEHQETHVVPAGPEELSA